MNASVANTNTAPDEAQRSAKSAGRRFSAVIVRLGAIAAFAAIMIYFALFAPGFTSTYNLINVVEQSAILGVLAFGMTVVIIGGGSDITEGGIDLSIAANMGLCAAVYATLLSIGQGDFVAVAGAIATGMIIGGSMPWPWSGSASCRCWPRWPCSTSRRAPN